MLSNKMTELLHIKYPIIQAPMAGGVTTSKLVAEVSNCGCLGTIGAGYMTPTQMREQIREIRQLTSNFFGINLFVPNEFEVNEKEVELANQILKPIREQLNLNQETSDIPRYPSVLEKFKEQVQIVIEEKVPVCSFTFGIPPSEVIDELKQHNIILMGTATTVREAIEVEKSGMDIVVAQGSEAGGHRGNFMTSDKESLVGLMSLIPQVVDNVSIPVVAAGGIMDGRGLMASTCLGALGVQMGTAFLTCRESGAQEIHKEEIVKSHEDQVILTRSFSGKWARGIKNKFISDLQHKEETLPGFPVQNALTKEIRKASSAEKNKEFMSLWSGQSPRLAKKQTVQTLINTIIEQAENINPNYFG